MTKVKPRATVQTEQQLEFPKPAIVRLNNVNEENPDRINSTF